MNIQLLSQTAKTKFDPENQNEADIKMKIILKHRNYDRLKIFRKNPWDIRFHSE